MSFADKINREVAMFDWERDYYDWLRLPPWERFADSNDRIAGQDEEPGQPVSYPTHEQLEKLAGRQLPDLEGVPY